MSNHGAAVINKILSRFPTSARGHIVAVIGEFSGTILFLLFAFGGTQVANISSNIRNGTTIITTASQKTPQELLYISLSFGFSLIVNVWVFVRVSGGLFNPAVTVGMWLIGSITLARAALLFVTQIIGATVAAALTQTLFTGDLNVSTTLDPTTSLLRGTVIELILTAQLVFTIFMLAAEKHQGNFIAPIGIGLSLFIAELTGVFWTGGSLNPARSIGPAIVIRSFEPYHWIYWVGPMGGSVLAVLAYKLIKALEYETANPDSSSTSAPAVIGETGLGGTSTLQVPTLIHTSVEGQRKMETEKRLTEKRNLLRGHIRGATSESGSIV